MSFASNIKMELIYKNMTKEEIFEFLKGLIFVFYENDNLVKIKLARQNISNTIKQIFKFINIECKISDSDKRHFIIDSKLFGDIKNVSMPEYYLAGVFVGSGSISKLETTSYHLEMQFYLSESAIYILNILNETFKFNFTMIKRRKMYVLYLKRSEQIADFLKTIQAIDSLFVFEDQRIQRDYSNQLNRYSNLDIYNQKKISIASGNFNEYFNFVKNNNLWHLFSDQEIVFYKLKKTNPYSSLQELVELLEKKNIQKTRSALNHWLIKLKNIYNDNVNKI